MRPVLHLMVTDTCKMNCPLCCNNQYNISDIPIVSVADLKSVDTVCITGGEPFFNERNLISLITNMREQNPIERVIVYTTGMYLQVHEFLLGSPLTSCIDGLSIGPKCDTDWINLHSMSIFKEVYDACRKMSNRIYVFPEQEKNAKLWDIEQIAHTFNAEVIRREWQKKFVPAPNTIFRRLPIFI